MVPDPTPTGARSGGWLGRPRLLCPAPVGFPYRQTTTVTTDAVDRTGELATRYLAGVGFKIISPAELPGTSTPVPNGGPGPRLLFLAERNIRFEEPDLVVRVTIWTLLGAGLALGGLDASIYVSFFVIFPWFGAFAGMALLFWYTYGRCYGSEVVMAVVDLPRARGAGASGAAPRDSDVHTLTWLAGGVRSDTRSAPEMGLRQPVRIDREFRVVPVLAALIKLAGPGTAAPGVSPRPVAVPAGGPP